MNSGESRNGSPHAKKNAHDESENRVLGDPPQSRITGEFVAHMEEVLETLRKAVRFGRSGHLYGRATGAVAERNASAHPRHGQTCRLALTTNTELSRLRPTSSMFTEPLAGWRVAVRESVKTKIDWATEMARLLARSLRWLQKGDCSV